MDVRQELKEYADQSATRIPTSKLSAMQDFQKKLHLSNIMQNIIKKGDKFPEFTLFDIHGQVISSKELLSKGRLIVAFFRGGWCPYCNIELRGYQNILNEIYAKKAQIVAISPEIKVNSESLSDKHSLEFPILFDENNTLGKKLNIVFKLDDSITEVYNSFGIDLQKSQNNTNNELPIPATFILDTDSTILHCEALLDYKERMDPKDTLKYL